jgi:uncharacterized membrane protein
MSDKPLNAARFVWAALIAGAIAHVALVQAVPRVLMDKAIERIGAGGSNAWRVADRVTPESRQIVRPTPDFAYSACAYDLSDGPVTIRVEPWSAYWSLSLYADNSDNFFVVDDREARNGVTITLVQRGRRAPEDAPRVVRSPSERGIALIRRLAPTPDEYAAAALMARGDVCAAAPSS